MKIAIIGSGNVAYHLAKALKGNQQNLVQIFGRNEVALKSIADELDIPFSTTELADADLYIISISDSSVEEVSMRINKPDAIVAHTSGSLPKEILNGNYRKASFYPLQTFSKTKDLDFKTIPFFIDAEDKDVEKVLVDLASKMSNYVEVADFEKRKYIHLTAVFACNFVNHLFARAKEISDSQKIPFDYFMPLIEETFDKIKSVNPKDAQTGPAVRNDKRILELHKELLKNPEQLAIYNVMNTSIKEMYNLD
ncbi:DUF2520 domain-containing protein [Soonwooa sp.]|uniref:Rossmann-like and DUF2520 domain-containing protein n=1 Tax=Soonwooa sp. TaxID=1938592 RepID=UPI0026363060|nr:DUF2520 domain-containing protein [Soonwooa sp.]